MYILYRTGHAGAHTHTRYGSLWTVSALAATQKVAHGDAAGPSSSAAKCGPAANRELMCTRRLESERSREQGSDGPKVRTARMSVSRPTGEQRCYGHTTECYAAIKDCWNTLEHG